MPQQPSPAPKPPPSPRSLPNGWPRRWHRRLVRRSLSTKILIAYGIAFGVSFIGLGTGIVWAKNIGHQADIVQLEVIEDLENIHHLQSSISRILIHHLAITNWLRSPSQTPTPKFLATLSALRQDYLAFQEGWEILLASDEFGGSESDELLQSAVPTDGEQGRAIALLRDYKPDVQQYLRDTETFFNTIDPALPVPPPALLIPSLSTLEQTNLLQRLDGFTHQIGQFIAEIEQEQDQAQLLNRAARQTQLNIVVGGTILSGLLGLLLILLLTRSLLKPLKEMTHLTQKSIEDGDFNIQIPVRTADESGVLAETFNAYSNFTAALLQEQATNNAVLNSTLAELQQSQVQVIQSEKMSSLGQMVSGIAHEINNPLGFISSNIMYMQGYINDVLGIIALYQDHYPEPPEVIQNQAKEIDLKFLQEDLREILKSMKIGSARIREIINSLRNFSRIDESQIIASNLHEGIENTLLILSHRFKASPDSPTIQIDKHYGELPDVECYPGLLNQVFMNILANAIDALEEVYHAQPPTPQTLESLVKRQSSGPNYQIQITTAMVDEGRWVKIAIADNGPGIPNSVRQKIFDPFFTTKPAGKGTGMGMSISLQIVTEKHGGRFECDSQPGEGTTFIVQLPVSHSDRLICVDEPVSPAIAPQRLVETNATS